MNSGQINPHQYHPGLIYKQQLQHLPPLTEQRNRSHSPSVHDAAELGGNNDDFHFECDDDVDPIDTINGLQQIETGQMNDDKESAFSEQQCKPETAADHNLGCNFDNEANPPSKFKGISMLYEKMKRKVPPEDRKPKGRKQPKGEMCITSIALSQLL